MSGLYRSPLFAKCPAEKLMSLFRALTELLKQPGEAGGVDRGGGGHHPIGSNGISGRSMRTNNGESELQTYTVESQSQGLKDKIERQMKYNEHQTFNVGGKRDLDRLLAFLLPSPIHRYELCRFWHMNVNY